MFVVSSSVLTADWLGLGIYWVGLSWEFLSCLCYFKTTTYNSRMASGQDGKRAPNYPSRDARAEHGGPGFGAKPKPRGQPKARAQPIRQPNKVKLGGPDCTLCTGLCCEFLGL